jgi:DNA-binding transcriptional regulator YiaG
MDEHSVGHTDARYARPGTSCLHRSPEIAGCLSLHGCHSMASDGRSRIVQPMQVRHLPRLTELRKQKRLELYDVAALLRITEGQVRRYENGQSVIPTLRARILAEHFGVTVEHLMGWDREPEPTEERPAA